MVNLRELEKNYLICLMKGADAQPIALTGGLEEIHTEIRRLKAKGFVVIPQGIIPETLAWNFETVSRNLVDLYVEEIREAQTRIAVKKSAATINYNLPADMIIENLRVELDALAEKAGMNQIISASDLQKTEFENTEFILDKMLPVGLTLLIGPPKMGKSWLLLLWSTCIVIGFPIFTRKVKRVPVLYYTLEDSVKRCKYRLNKLSGNQQVRWSDKLFFVEKANGTVGIMNDIRATGARVVIIDTFGSFTSIKDGNDYYETTRTIRELKEIADTLQVAVLVVHHTRKNGREDSGDDWTADIMGSQGLVGAADAIISLKRKWDSADAKLLITGRDITDHTIPIRWNDGTWELVNEC